MKIRIEALLLALLFVGVPAAMATVAGTATRMVGNAITFQGSSGADAFNFATNGLHGHFGTGTNDYIISDGTNISTPGTFTASSLLGSGSAVAALKSSSTGWLEMVGDTSANLTGTTPSNGALQYDTTNSCFRAFTGGAWSGGCVLVASAIQTTRIPWTFFTGSCGDNAAGACSTDVNFLGPFESPSNSGYQKATLTNVTCNWGTAGVGGTTGVVVQVFDSTASSEVCSCTLGACTTSARSNLECTCSATLTNVKHIYNLRLKSTTDCATKPSEVWCSVGGFVTQ